MPLPAAAVPALISAGGSLLGGLFGSSSNRSAAAANAQAQREFAQHGVRWKVADAKAAGLHPLAALGASTTSFSPSYVGDQSMGTALAGAGQDIGRAIDATRTEHERKVTDAAHLARQAVIDQANLEKSRGEVNLLNTQAEYYRAQTEALRNRATNPPMAGGPTGRIPGQATWSAARPNPLPPDQVLPKPNEIISHSSDAPYSTAGVKPGFDKIRTPAGEFYWPSSELNIDDTLPLAAMLLSGNWPEIKEFLSRTPVLGAPAVINKILQGPGPTSSKLPSQFSRRRPDAYNHR